MNTVQIQVHDYDDAGRYLIVKNCEVTKDEAEEWKKKARESVKIDWGKLPAEVAHIVYYAELLDKSDTVWFVGVYMHGCAYDDKEFERIFQRRPDMGRVGAFHKSA